MKARQPLVSLITTGDGVGAFPRIARWLLEAFEELEVPFDAVLVGVPNGVSEGEFTRRICLDVRARNSIPALVRYLRRARPTITLAAPGHVVPFALAAGRMAGCSVLPWEQTFFPADLADATSRMSALPFLHRLTYGWARGVAAVSTDVASHVRTVRNISREHIHLVPNPVDAKAVREQAGSPQPRDGLFRFCTVGNLFRQKGADVLLEALAIAEPSLPRAWELMLVGDGPRRAELEALARTRGIADHVTFHGEIANAYPVMARADVFVSPSRWEGFGVALVEALSLGVPVVATACPGGPSEILAGGEHGLLVPSEDPAKLADALIRIAADDALRARLAVAGRERAENYAPRRVAERLVRLAREAA